MTPDISERAFEEAIECALLQNGLDASRGEKRAVRESGPGYGEEVMPGRYHRRRPHAATMFSVVRQLRYSEKTEQSLDQVPFLSGVPIYSAGFHKPEYRFLVVASKFQTGFDQPLLHTMYVDKKLGGVKNPAALVHRGLELLIQREGARRLAALGGGEAWPPLSRLRRGTREPGPCWLG